MTCHSEISFKGSPEVVDLTSSPVFFLFVFKVVTIFGGALCAPEKTRPTLYYNPIFERFRKSIRKFLSFFKYFHQKIEKIKLEFLNFIKISSKLSLIRQKKKHCYVDVFLTNQKHFPSSHPYRASVAQALPRPSAQPQCQWECTVSLWHPGVLPFEVFEFNPIQFNRNRLG